MFKAALLQNAAVEDSSDTFYHMKLPCLLVPYPKTKADKARLSKFYKAKMEAPMRGLNAVKLSVIKLGLSYADQERLIASPEIITGKCSYSILNYTGSVELYSTNTFLTNSDYVSLILQDYIASESVVSIITKHNPTPATHMSMAQVSSVSDLDKILGPEYEYCGRPAIKFDDHVRAVYMGIYMLRSTVASAKLKGLWLSWNKAVPHVLNHKHTKHRLFKRIEDAMYHSDSYTMTADFHNYYCAIMDNNGLDMDNTA
eukprot:10606825-Ditylum_brightwellii.AAC.1